MIVPDLNLLIYAHDSESPFHRRSREWWESVLGDPNQVVGVAPLVGIGFVRLTCNPRIMKSPILIEQAEEIVLGWFKSGAYLMEVTPRHFEIFFELLKGANAGPNLTSDAHIAALAIEHDGTVYSNDTDFIRFKGVKVVNPLRVGN